MRSKRTKRKGLAFGLGLLLMLVVDIVCLWFGQLLVSAVSMVLAVIVGITTWLFFDLQTGLFCGMMTWIFGWVLLAVGLELIGGTMELALRDRAEPESQGEQA